MTGIVPEWIAQMREGHYPKEMAPAVRRLEQALLLMSREFEEERFTPTSVSLNGFTERLNQLLAHPEELVKPLVVKERTPPGRPSTAGDRMRGSQPTPEEAPSVKLRTDHLRAICQASQRRFGVRALTGIKAARLDAALDKNNPRPLRVEEEALIVKAFSLPEGWFQSTHKHRTLSTSDFEQRLKQGATALGLS
jgi:hypothetical protein